MELVNKVLTYWYSYFPPTWPDRDWFVRVVWKIPTTTLRNHLPTTALTTRSSQTSPDLTTLEPYVTT